VTPEQAFDQYHQAVFRFLFRMTRRPEVAEDLTQDTFVAFLRGYDGSRGAVRTYLFAIARNLALKQFRDYAGAEPLEAGPCFSLAIPSVEVGAAVAEVVESLPPLQREALVLFEYEGFTLEEIAEVVSADIGTVKSRLHRARERLKRALAPLAVTRRAHGTN
jgi:DNA-directed RNA polymerase specialized sigma24 family protein